MNPVKINNTVCRACLGWSSNYRFVVWECHADGFDSIGRPSGATADESFWRRETRKQIPKEVCEDSKVDFWSACTSSSINTAFPLRVTLENAKSQTGSKSDNVFNFIWGCCLYCTYFRLWTHRLGCCFWYWWHNYQVSPVVHQIHVRINMLPDPMV